MNKTTEDWFSDFMGSKMNVGTNSDAIERLFRVVLDLEGEVARLRRRVEEQDEEKEY